MQKLNGAINLSKIDKKFIKKNKNGESILYIDIVPNRNGVDQYGNTHSVQIWDSAERKTIYLGNLKTLTIGGAPQTDTPKQVNEDSDLPF